MPLTLNDLPNAALVKNETEKIHADVEGLLLPKLSAIQTTDDYAAILKMFYGYFKPVEGAIAAHVHPEHLPDIGERRNAALLLHDLCQIGHLADHPSICTTLPHITNTAQAFSALYVLEGSTLGGKYIAKMLAKNPAIPNGATRFFSGYGEQTGSKWKRFLKVFNQQSDSDAMLASAIETFFYLKGWMQQAL
ncbi:MAG: biliverdin-producing heme oxygenase [Bacteroidota bacterium]|nr:biliverdin-producing heme oxygenase [Bacteroidota bacterium]